MSIPVFSATAATDDIADALDEAGCVVVTGVFDESARMRVRQELSPYMERVAVEDDDPAEFYAGLTRRTSALVARSETVGELVVDEMSEKMCDRFLSPNGEFGYHLHVSAALEVGPGARRQILHREEDSFTFFPSAPSSTSSPLTPSWVPTESYVDFFIIKKLGLIS